MRKQYITAEQLRELLDYDPVTGEFRWKKRLSQGTQVGRIAGGLNAIGYWQIGIFRHRYYAHRLAWCHVHGEWPSEEIDHIDGNPANNCLSNLRPTNRSVNMQNRTKIKTKAASGLIGAYKRKGGIGYTSKVMTDGKSIHLGNFDTAEEAHAAYVQAKRKLHEGNTL